MLHYIYSPMYCPVYYPYVYQPNEINYPIYYESAPLRQFPQVDSTFFEQSAKSMQTLMKDASIVLNKLAESKPFANKIMSAAQHSKMTEVEKLIKSTGIKSKVDTSFNPDGINMKLSSTVGDTDCCHLTIALRWM